MDLLSKLSLTMPGWFENVLISDLFVIEWFTVYPTGVFPKSRCLSTEFLCSIQWFTIATCFCNWSFPKVQCLSTLVFKEWPHAQVHRWMDGPLVVGLKHATVLTKLLRTFSSLSPIAGLKCICSQWVDHAALSSIVAVTWSRDNKQDEIPQWTVEGEIQGSHLDSHSTLFCLQHGIYTLLAILRNPVFVCS